MEYLFVLLLMTIARVQGFYSELNATKENRFDYNLVSREDRRQRQFKLDELGDDVFEHYRSEKPRREPRFISFQTKDDNIEVEIDFAVPFLSIPVKRSLSGAMGTLQNVIKGIPMANVNVGAILLTGFVVVGGAMIGGISRLVNGGSFIEIAGSLPWFRSGNKKQKNNGADDPEESNWWRVIDQIDKALLKYDFDTTACTQRAICWHVKESLANIEEGKASNFDHLISGLTSSEWAIQLISSTSWNDAVFSARNGQSCEATFSSCKLSPNNLEKFTKKLLQFATKRRK